MKRIIPVMLLSLFAIGETVPPPPPSDPPPYPTPNEGRVYFVLQICTDLTSGDWNTVVSYESQYPVAFARVGIEVR